MAITKVQKQELVAKYTEAIQHSEAIIITEYRGLSVADLQDLRSKLRDAEGSYYVVKNTLAKLALQQIGRPTLDNLLVGPVGIGFCGQNVPGAAKVIVDFAKGKDKLLIKGGLMGNSVLDEKGVDSLTKLPTIEVARAQLLGLINTPATQLAVVLNAPASQLVNVMSGGVRQLVNVLNAYATKEQAA
ncbi:MAG TPA: 50S ribosomal protein L10 [Anaerolineae bacterium]|nr:50S ribosomal protein L10 [Anaerolineae bacterium]HMR65029.1 50S ribosomal protein L10 [Anaerolineae bacterium]